MYDETTITKLEESIVSEMQRLKYAPETIRIFRLNCRKFKEYAIESQNSELYSETIGESYLSNRYNFPLPELRPLTGTERNAVRCVRWLGEFNSYGGFTSFGMTHQPSVDEWGMDDVSIIIAFVNGTATPDNSEETKSYRRLHLRGFYSFVAGHKVTSITALSPEIISSYVLSLQGYAATTTQHRLSTVRRYLHYAYRTGYTKRDWSFSVPVMKKVHNQRLPALWTDEEILKLLGTIDRASPVGKRDYAILLLVVDLALRITDVSELTFDSIDWETRTINIVQHKTHGSNNALPISDDLGWAIIEYLRYGRPASDLPYVFLSGNAPYRQMASHSVGDIIRRAMTKAGIKKQKLITGGMHSLRHAKARKLLNEGVPLTEIANIMGHANYSSTSP